MPDLLEWADVDATQYLEGKSDGIRMCLGKVRLYSEVCVEREESYGDHDADARADAFKEIISYVEMLEESLDAGNL